MPHSDFIILLILIALQELKSQNDDFERFLEDIKTNTHAEYFSAKHNEDDIAQIGDFIKSVQTDREGTRIKNPSYCRSFETCHECIKSLWYECGWCHNFGCTSNPEQLCPYTKRTTNAINSCPYISHKGPILIPSGFRRHIKVEISTPDPALYNAEIICQLKLKKKLTHLKGMLLNEFVYCYPFTLSVKDHPDTETGTLNLIWSGAEPFSNEIPVIVYRCETLATDCEGCRMLPPEYGCGWCSDRNSCVIAEKCTDFVKWTVNRLKCDVFGKKLYYV